MFNTKYSPDFYIKEHEIKLTDLLTRYYPDDNDLPKFSQFSSDLFLSNTHHSDTKSDILGDLPDLIDDSFLV